MFDEHELKYNWWRDADTGSMAFGWDGNERIGFVTRLRYADRPDRRWMWAISEHEELGSRVSFPCKGCAKSAVDAAAELEEAYDRLRGLRSIPMRFEAA